MPPPADPAPAAHGLLRLLVRIAFVAFLVWAIHSATEWAMMRTEASGQPAIMLGLLAILLAVYILTLATPFMPGIEFGLSLLISLGAQIAPYVYLATVTGLMIAFLAGRFLPYRWLRDALSDLRLTRAASLIDRLGAMTRKERLEELRARAPSWCRPLTGRARYLLLALLINLPGNVVFGGGGGLAFAAGFSRLFSTPATLLTVAIAVFPVPFAVWFWGIDILPAP
ncbi:MAG: hypothetical protein QNJ35_07520 [Paracoccaceae bacterium]|nr:hypothetical protein [Paracoccaceae bacterium]